MGPICVTCKTVMCCHKNGRAVEFVSGGEPYQIWHGDEWACRMCGASVIVGFPSQPMEEAFRPSYAVLRQAEMDHDNLVTVEV